MLKRFEIFKAGKYPQGNFTEDDVKALFEAYDPAWWKAPFTVEHVRSGPAWGFVENLHFENGRLFADSGDVNAAMRDLVAAKHFGPVSVEIFKNIDKDGVKTNYLGAVSFLGVKAPQIKGLEAIAFSDAFENAESVCFAFQVTGEGDEMGLTLMSPEELEQFSQARAKADADAVTMSDQLAAVTAERDALLLKFSDKDAERMAAEEKLRSIELNQRRLGFEGFLNERIAYGNVSPKQKGKLLKLLEALDQVALFDATHKDAPTEFKEFLTSLPKQVDFTERAKPDPDADKTPSAKELGDEALKFQQSERESGRFITLASAMAYITKPKT